MPCPQCGRQNGGMQLVIFNPKSYEERTGYARREPYVVLRISHYSASSRKIKKQQTKIWHNFQIHIPGILKGSEFIRLDQIFDDFEYKDKQSVSLPIGDDLFGYIKANGWQVCKIKTEGAHWVNKTGDLKKCQECHMYFKSELVKKFNYPKGYWNLKYSWLCESCYAVDLAKLARWNQELRHKMSKNK